MMSLNSKKVYFTGDSLPMEIQLRTGADPEPITDGSTVTVGFVANKRSRELLAGPWNAIAATPGAQWSTGKIVVAIPGADTEALDAQSALVEVQVVTGSNKLTYRSKSWFWLEKGALP